VYRDKEGMQQQVQLQAATTRALTAEFPFCLDAQEAMYALTSQAHAKTFSKLNMPTHLHHVQRLAFARQHFWYWPWHAMPACPVALHHHLLHVLLTCAHQLLPLHHHHAHLSSHTLMESLGLLLSCSMPTNCLVH